MIEQPNLFGDMPPIEVKPVEQVVPTPKSSGNPCIALYGSGPDDKHCGDCAMIAGICLAKTYYKCRLRKNTHGAATDHRRSWPVCAKFEQRNGDIPLYDGRSA